MASPASEVEMTPVPTKDETDGKPEEQPTIETIIETQVARFKLYQNIIAQFLNWLRLIVFCAIEIRLRPKGQ